MWKSPPAFRMLFGGGTQDRWRNYSHPRYRRIVNDWTGRSIEELSTDELLDGVQELVDAAAEYYTAVQTIIPVAATSEMLFTWLLRRGRSATKDDPPAQVFLLGYRQRADQGGEVALRSRGLDARPSRADRVATGAAAAEVP